jgi:magnesium chelatase family protein
MTCTEEDLLPISTLQHPIYCKLDNASMSLLERAMETMGLSARAYHRILKIARTIAELDGSETVTSTHITKAIQYPSLERK